MSYFSHAFTKVFVGNGTIKTTGSTADLTAGDIGLYDYNTFAALPSTPAGNTKRMFIIAQGSYHTTDSLSPFYAGLSESVKSRGINPAFIDKFYYTAPADAVADVWTVGYNGVTSACNCITGSCDNKYSLRIDVKGDQASRTFNRNLYRVITVDTPCCDAGCDSCADGAVDPLWIATKFVEKINADMELKNFVFAELVYETKPAFTENDVLTYTISVTDAGDAGALTAVKTEYPDWTAVTRVSYAVGVSIYTVVLPGDAAIQPLTGDSIGGQSVTVSSETALIARELCITIPGLTSQVAAIDTFYTDNTTVAGATIKTTGTSAITYSIFQSADEAVEVGADTVGVPVYSNLQSYEGQKWDACPCLTAAAAYTDCIGIKLTAAYEDTVFGNCSFKPTDYYNLQPLKIYVSKVDDAELCTDDHMAWTITHLVESKQATGLGETALREYILSMGYKQEFWEPDLRLREAIDQTFMTVIDRTKKYKSYHLHHTIPNWTRGMNVKSYDEKYVLCFFFEENVSTTAFETIIGNYAAIVNGITMETIG